ncbi:hypothetical protein [Nostoc sp. MG11]|uniref:hypothetical protein n=1 Tax=Nostoc sp. MG11 TaxID=2721166 RepID=UPI0018683601|nr:hypothetical protein [Nostoc sp. MG11]
MTIDFQKVRQRIDTITAQIEKVLMKYHTPEEIFNLKQDYSISHSGDNRLQLYTKIGKPDDKEIVIR